MFGIENSDNGPQLKNIGLQLQALGTQIQNTGLQLSSMNNNYGIQINNMGIEISKFSIQIFNIGMQVSNVNQNPNYSNEFLMNNMMGNMNMMNFNQPLENIEINNNNLYNNNENNFDNSIIFTFEFENNGKRTIININENETVKELLNRYLIKIGKSYGNLDKFTFLYNGITINQNENRTILEYGIKNGSRIIVCKNFNVIGGPTISFKITSEEEPFYIGLDDFRLNRYLKKYFKIIGKSNLEKTIDSFPEIYIIDFFKKINEIPNK